MLYYLIGTSTSRIVSYNVTTATFFFSSSRKIRKQVTLVSSAGDLVRKGKCRCLLLGSRPRDEPKKDHPQKWLRRQGGRRHWVGECRHPEASANATAAVAVVDEGEVVVAAHENVDEGREGEIRPALRRRGRRRERDLKRLRLIRPCRWGLGSGW